MTVTPIVTSNRRFIRAAKATVYVADALREAEFVEVYYLRLDVLRVACGPEIDQAQFAYHYGDIIREDGTAVVYFPPLSLGGKFVKVFIEDFIYSDDFSDDPDTTTVNMPIFWYGRIEHDERHTAGTVETPVVASSSSASGSGSSSSGSGSSSSASSSSAATEEHQHGVQLFTAYGLLRLLEQEIVDSSYVDLGLEASSSLSEPDRLFKVPTGLDFNSDPGGQFVRRGNRTAAKVDGSYVFNWEPRGFDLWTAHNAVEYLLKRQVPLDSTGAVANTWRLDSDVDYLDWYDIDLRTNGRTVKSIIDDLIPRQRAVGYWVDFDTSLVDPEDDESGSKDEIVLHVFTFLDTDLVLPNGQTIKANPDQRSLDFEHALDVTEAIVANTMVSRYHRIITRGEKRTTTCTVRLGTGPHSTNALIRAWSTDEEIEYKVAASGAPDYAALTLEQQQTRNAIYRSSDRLNEVYRRFKLNCDITLDRWLCLITDPFNVDVEEYFLRGDQTTDPYDAQSTADDYEGTDYIPALRITRALPLYERVDYSADNLETFDYSTAFAANTHPSFIPPFVFAKTTDADLPEDRRYEMTDKLHRSYAAAGNRTWSTRVTCMDTEPAIEITADPPHLLSGADAGAFAVMADHENNEIRRGIPYTDMYATICIELTEQVQHEEVLLEPPTDAPEQVLILQVPGARFDYVIPYTVVEIKDGVPVQTTSGGFAKNDMLRLKSIARAAAEWYSKERQTLSLAFRQVRGLFTLGWLITDVGTYDLDPDDESCSSSSTDNLGINTPITAITYHMGQGGQPGHTRIETAYTSLDFTDDGLSKSQNLHSAGTGSNL